MLRFDEERKLLFAFKNDISVGVDDEIEPNVDYESFQRYISKQVKEDVMNIFLPKLRSALKIEDIDLGIEDIQVCQVDRGYFDDKDYHVRVKWSSYRNFMSYAEHNNEWISIMRIPMVDEDGFIYHDESRYSLIKMLEQEETVSIDCSKPGEEKLKIKTSNAAIVFLNSASGIQMQLSTIKSKSDTKKYKALYAMAAKMRDETGDNDAPMQLWKDFSDYSIRKTINEKNIFQQLYLYGGNTGSIDASEYTERVVPFLRGYFVNSDGDITQSETYCIKNLRGELNEILSLKRAVGKILAKDVYSEVDPTVRIASRGEQVSDVLVRRMESQRVTKIYLESTPNVEGYYLSQILFIDVIKKGTKITDDIATYLPEEQGMYISRDYNFVEEGRDPIILYPGTRITKQLIELLRECGAEELKITRDENGSDERETALYLTEEVISNRHFLRDNLGEKIDPKDYDKAESWFYLDWDGTVKPAQDYLTAADIQALISLFSKLCKGQYKNIVTNIDTGFRKKLVLMEELMHRAFRYACNRGFEQMSGTFRELWKDPAKFFKRDEMDNNFYPFHKNFFKYMREETKSLQVLSGDSMTNPISFISATTKINTFVKDKNSVASEQRRIAIGSYSRVDAYETPQSGKMGTVLNKTIGCKITPDGKMLAPYYKVKWGNMGKPTVDFSKKEYFTVKQEEKFIIGDISALQLTKDGTVINKDDYILCKVPSTNSVDRHTFSYISVTKIQYVNADPNQSLSWAAQAIPFLGSNDAARTIFGISQAKQAKGCVSPEIPLAMTKANLMIPRLNNEFAFIAREDGVVVDTGKYIQEEYDKKNPRKDIDKIWVSIRYDSQGPEDGIIKSWHEVSSTKYSTTVRKICVESGQRFKKGDVLMTSNFIVDGILAMGKNAFVGYIPTGYNYEDGSDVSSDFCNNFISYRENHEEVLASSKNSYIPRIEKAIYGKWITRGSDAFSLNWSPQGSTVARKTKCSMKKAEGFLESIKPMIDKDKHGRRWCKGIDVTLMSIDPMQAGDKNSNRHGNKGVLAAPTNSKFISRPTEEMPRLLNGKPLDIAYNPLGTISRMNMGQCKECNATLPAGIIGYRLVTDPYNGISDEEINTLLHFVYELANSTGDPSYIGYKVEYNIIPENLKAYAYRRIEDIRFWANTFDERGEAYLLLPDNGMQKTKTKVLVGWVYVFKLIQESEKKLHVRGGFMTEEPYSMTTGAATEGSSNHGGQRYGVMELDALFGYGVSNFINECVNECGDNAVARSNLNVDVFAPNSIKEDMKLNNKGQRRSVTNFLYSLAAMGIYNEPDNGEFIPLSKTNCDELYSYKRSAIADMKDSLSDNSKSTSQSSASTSPIAKVAEMAKAAVLTEAESVDALLAFGVKKH